jgi:hypothetical protein
VGRWVVIGLVVIALISIAFVVLASIYPEFRAISRDIAIVVSAIFQVVSAVLMVAILVAIIFAVQYIRSLSQTTLVPKAEQLMAKLDQVMENANTISGNARNTATKVGSATSYVTEQVVAPVIRISSLFAGVRAAASYLARRDEKSPDI